MKRDAQFEDFLCARNDELDNAAYALLCLACGGDTDALPWDMSLIGELEDFIESLLRERGHQACHPFFEDNDRTPCYRGKSCGRSPCCFNAAQ